jgi:hypothetical protein
MKFNLSQIKLTRYDIERNLKLPKKHSKELAEFIGILAGDGYVSFNTKRNVISISGDSRYDHLYLKNYVSDLIKSLFNLDTRVYKRKGANTAVLDFESKTLVEFLIKIGYYKHHSRNIKIPNWILKDKEFFIHLIKGLADTDFSLMLYRNRKLHPHYPVISLTLADKDLIVILSKFLKELGFNVDLILNADNFDPRFNKIWHRSRLRLSGRLNLQLWMDLIGFRNFRHINKYKEYLESGKTITNRGRPPKQLTLNLEK